jgi:hypothetical protein
LLLAEYLLEAGQLDEAGRALAEVEALLVGVRVDDLAIDLHLAELRVHLLTVKGEVARALPLLGDVLLRLERMFGKEHVELKDIHATAAQAHAAAGDRAAALSEWDRFRALALKSGTRPSPATAAGLLERAALVLETPEAASAVEEGEAALAALEAGGPATAARLAARRRWAEALWRTPAHRPRARRVIESALPNLGAADRADVEAWLAAHRD